MTNLINRLRITTMAVLAVFAFAACDSSTSALQQGEADADEFEVFTASIASDLSLSATQASSMNEVAARHGGGDIEEPGFLWQLALSLSQELSAEQIEEMLARADAARRPGLGFGPPAPRPGPRGHVSLRDILTDEQREAVQAIRAEYEDQIRALVDALREDGADREAIRAELEALHEEIRTRVDALLSDEQRAQIEEARAEAEAARAAWIEAELAAMGEVLQVDPVDVQAIRDAVRAEVETLRAEVEAGTLTREEFVEQAQAIGEAARAELETLLGDTFVVYEIHEALALRARQHRDRRGGPNGGPGQGRPGGGPGGSGGPGGGPGGFGGPGVAG